MLLNRLSKLRPERKKKMPAEPDVIYDNVILPERDRCVVRIYALLAGTEEARGYDNIQQVVEESLNDMYNAGIQRRTNAQ